MDSKVDRQYSAGCSLILKMDSWVTVKEIRGSRRIFKDCVIIFLAQGQVPSIRNKTDLRPTAFFANNRVTSSREIFREFSPGYKTIQELPGSSISAFTRSLQVKSIPTIISEFRSVARQMRPVPSFSFLASMGCMRRMNRVSVANGLIKWQRQFSSIQ